MRYYLVAGEASGDLHASNLMKAIAQRDSSAQFRCFGGDMMEAAGGQIVKGYLNDVLTNFFRVVCIVRKGLGIGNHDEDLVESALVLQLNPAS